MAAFSSGSHYAINILAADQKALAERFATQGSDRWTGVSFTEGAGGAPLLSGAVASFECFNRSRYDEGDHVIFVGEVLAFDHSDRAPLAFQSGQYALATRKPRSELRLDLALERGGRVLLDDCPDLRGRLGKELPRLAERHIVGPRLDREVRFLAGADRLCRERR